MSAAVAPVIPYSIPRLRPVGVGKERASCFSMAPFCAGTVDVDRFVPQGSPVQLCESPPCVRPLAANPNPMTSWEFAAHCAPGLLPQVPNS